MDTYFRDDNLSFLGDLDCCAGIDKQEYFIEALAPNLHVAYIMASPRSDKSAILHLCRSNICMENIASFSLTMIIAFTTFCDRSNHDSNRTKVIIALSNFVTICNVDKRQQKNGGNRGYHLLIDNAKRQMS